MIKAQVKGWREPEQRERTRRAGSEMEERVYIGKKGFIICFVLVHAPDKKNRENNVVHEIKLINDITEPPCKRGKEAERY